jgi:hypothetical protein
VSCSKLLVLCHHSNSPFWLSVSLLGPRYTADAEFVRWIVHLEGIMACSLPGYASLSCCTIWNSCLSFGVVNSELRTVAIETTEATSAPAARIRSIALVSERSDMPPQASTCTNDDDFCLVELHVMFS